MNEAKQDVHQDLEKGQIHIMSTVLGQVVDRAIRMLRARWESRTLGNSNDVP